VKHPFPCQCVQTIRLNNSLNRNSYTTRSFTLSSHPRTSERFLAAQSSVVHHGNDCNVQWCAICPCELPAVYHTATLDRCALVGRWKVWETGALDGECGGAAHIHATAGMFCTTAEQTSSSASRLALSSHQCLTCLLHCNQPSAEISKQMAAGGRNSRLHWSC